jgi:hypothetical protein
MFATIRRSIKNSTLNNVNNSKLMIQYNAGRDTTFKVDNQAVYKITVNKNNELHSSNAMPTVVFSGTKLPNDQNYIDGKWILKNFNKDHNTYFIITGTLEGLFSFSKLNIEIPL